MEESDEETIEYSIEIVESSSSPASSIANDLSRSSSSSSIDQQEQQQEDVATSEQQEEDNKTTRIDDEDEEVFELIPESVDQCGIGSATSEVAENESDRANRCDDEQQPEADEGDVDERRTEEANENLDIVQQSVIVVELGAEDEQNDKQVDQGETRQELNELPTIDQQHSAPVAAIDEQPEIPLDHQTAKAIDSDSGPSSSVESASAEATSGCSNDDLMNQSEQVSLTSHLPCHYQQEAPSNKNDDVNNNNSEILPTDADLPGPSEAVNTACEPPSIEPPSDENPQAPQPEQPEQPEQPKAASENQQVPAERAVDLSVACPAPSECSGSPDMFEDTLEGPVEQQVNQHGPDAEIATDVRVDTDEVLGPIDVESDEEQQCPVDQAPFEDSLQEQVAGSGEFGVSTVVWEPHDEEITVAASGDDYEQEKQWPAGQVVPETVIATAPPLPHYLYLADEDLELEFDNEPVFEARNIEIELGVNPRDRYSLQDELGRGKFGTVYRCVEHSSGKSFAAKFVHMRRREDRDDVRREIEIMGLLQHKRLLQLFEAFDDANSEMCLITELVEGGELFERIVNNDFELTEKKAAIFMRQICEGVQYMHGLNIVHLDMKPENILCVSRTGNRIKLIDFGLARQLREDEPLRVMFGTPDFAAPEVLAYDQVSLATDMWSVGVICYVLLSGLSPFMGDSDIDTMANVTRATYDFEDEAFEPISDLAKDFISRLLVKDQSGRLRPGECLRHAWLQRGGVQLEASFRRRSSIRLAGIGELDISNIAKGSQMRLRAVAGSPVMADKGFRPPALDTRNLKKYVVRRRWHRTVHAILALQRMGAHLTF